MISIHNYTHTQSYKRKRTRLAKQWKVIEDAWMDLRDKMTEIQKLHGADVVEPNAILRLNVGGKKREVRRSTLTLVENSRLAAMFSGRWDKALRRDDTGRIFVDDNPKCFDKIITSLQHRKVATAMAVADGQQLPAPTAPRIDADQAMYLYHMMEFYGIDQFLTGIPCVRISSTKLLADRMHRTTLTAWLGKPKSLQLLYRYVSP